MRAMFRPEVPMNSRKQMLREMGRIVRAAPSLPPRRGRAKGWCPDPEGRDILATPEEIEAARCGDCKKLSIYEARRAIDEGARRVKICMTVSNSNEEHVFLEINGVPGDEVSLVSVFDPSIVATPPMPQRRLFPCESVTIWPPEEADLDEREAVPAPPADRRRTAGGPGVPMARQVFVLTPGGVRPFSPTATSTPPSGHKLAKKGYGASKRAGGYSQAKPPPGTVGQPWPFQDIAGNWYTGWLKAGQTYASVAPAGTTTGSACTAGADGSYCLLWPGSGPIRMNDQLDASQPGTWPQGTLMIDTDGNTWQNTNNGWVSGGSRWRKVSAAKTVSKSAPTKSTTSAPSASNTTSCANGPGYPRVQPDSSGTWWIVNYAPGQQRHTFTSATQACQYVKSRRWSVDKNGRWTDLGAAGGVAALPAAASSTASSGLTPWVSTRNRGQLVWNGSAWVPNPKYQQQPAGLPSALPPGYGFPQYTQTPTLAYQPAGVAGVLPVAPMPDGSIGCNVQIVDGEVYRVGSDGSTLLLGQYLGGNQVVANGQLYSVDPTTCTMQYLAPYLGGQASLPIAMPASDSSATVQQAAYEGAVEGVEGVVGALAGGGQGYYDQFGNFIDPSSPFYDPTQDPTSPYYGASAGFSGSFDASFGSYDPTLGMGGSGDQTGGYLDGGYQDPRG